MLTPFKENGTVDYDSLARLIDFYEAGGSDGLFAICQSSEMFFLSLEERVKIASFIKQHAHIPVIASGHVSYAPDQQVDELRRITDTGVDAVILITNRLAPEGAPSSVWMDNLQHLLDALDPKMPLGFYECPYPYKRLISLEELKFCAQTGRFRFLKDTCCDLDLIRKRLEIIKGSTLGLYNANTSTLLDSIKAGAAGFSGVMANFHPELYAWLLKNYEAQPEKAETMQAALTMFSLIERQLYPVNAKYHLTNVGVFESIFTRTKSHYQLTETFKEEVRQMARMADHIKKTICE